MRKAYIMGETTVQIGRIMHEPASGKTWRVGQPRPSKAKAIYDVDDQSMMDAKIAQQMYIEDCR